MQEEAKEEEIDVGTLSEADRIRYEYRKHIREKKKKERWAAIKSCMRHIRTYV